MFVPKLTGRKPVDWGATPVQHEVQHAGATCTVTTFEDVIPAKAGIQPAAHLDSGLVGMTKEANVFAVGSKKPAQSTTSTFRIDEHT
jgi:hypothetical protein